MNLGLMCCSIDVHVKSPRIAGRPPEICQTSRPLAWENKSPGFVMKQNNILVWPQLTKDRQSLLLFMPTTTIKFCADWRRDT